MLTNPLPAPVRDTLVFDDGEMALLRWENPGAPRIIFAHANGFCASAYKQMLGRLADQFDIVAPDMRGHGRSTLSTNPASHRNWYGYAQDLIALNTRLDRPADLAVGHSMGGTCWTLAASQMDQAPPLALIDPAMLPGWLYLVTRSPLRKALMSTTPIAKQARRRTSRWNTRDEVHERYAQKSNFQRWAHGVLADYLEDGLTEFDEGVRLSCDPEWEAANFEGHAHDLPKAGRKVARSIQLLKSQHGSVAMLSPMLARYGARVEVVEGTGHLVAMEDPAGTAQWVRKASESI